MLLLMKGKLVMWKLKLSRKPYSEVFKWPFASKDRSISKYEADLSLSVVSFISS